MPIVISAQELESNCFEILKQVERDRKTFVITKDGHPIVTLGPVSNMGQSTQTTFTDSTVRGKDA